MLGIRPPEPLFRTTLCHLRFGNLLSVLCHWLWFQSDMGTTPCDPNSYGDRNGLQGVYCAYLCGRELPGLYSGRPGHELADVDRFWYLPWFLC